MPATIASLLDHPELHLELIVGEGAALEAPIEWAATTEAAAPDLFVSGGQLVLTTGMRLRTAREQRAFANALADADTRGIVFSPGFEHPVIPEALLGEARKRELPVLQVPYEVPFSRIVRAVADASSSEQLAELESRQRLHHQLVTATLVGGGLDGLVAQLGKLTGARVAVTRWDELLAGSFDAPAAPGPARGGLGAGTARGRSSSGGAAASADEVEGWDSSPVTAGTGMPATLHVSRPRSNEFILSYARSLVSLQLDERTRRQRADRERAGQTFADVIHGRIQAEAAVVRLGALGLREGPHRVLVVVAPEPAHAKGLPQLPLPTSLEGAVAATLREELVVLLPERENGRAAAEAIVALGRAAGLNLRVGIGDAYPISQALRWSYYGARDALTHLEPQASIAEVARLSIASLLLAAKDVPVAELADEIVGPLERADRDHRSELVATLEVFLAESGAVARVASILGTHRNTVRYRLDQIAKLTGLDPRVTSEAVQLFLALEARLLLGRDGRRDRPASASGAASDLAT